MGTVLSSPRASGEGPGGLYNWNQLRPSKSTFSLKDKGGGGAISDFFRNGLSSSVSFRNLTIGGRSSSSRGDNDGNGIRASEQQQPPMSARATNEVSLLKPPPPPRPPPPPPKSNQSELSSDRRNNNVQLAAPTHSAAVPPAGGALTKSTSCYTLKQSGSSKRRSGSASLCLNPRPLGGRVASDDADSATAKPDNRRLVVQASTAELLKCTCTFLHRCCPEAAPDPAAAAAWIRSVDRCLILQGWADMAFVNPPNLVFLFLLLKAAVANDNKKRLVATERQLQAAVFACMYVAYSYMGNEISYPLKPFLVEDDRDAFWDRCLGVVGDCSRDMLRLNSDPTFFIDLFTELKSYA